MSKKKQRRKATAVPMIDTVAPPPGTNAAAALRALVPAPTAEEVINAINRFVHERMPEHPEEAIQFGMYLAVFVGSVDPATLEKYRALAMKQPTPPPDPGVN